MSKTQGRPSMVRATTTGQFVIREGQTVKGGVVTTGKLPVRPAPPLPSKVPATGKKG